jgi:glycosyltransferase involved in cell wall biosynthesis
MRSALDGTGVVFHPASGVLDAARLLVRLGRTHPDVVHSHMTAADLAAVASWPLVRAPLVSTLHFAQPRGRTFLRRTSYRCLPYFFRTQISISEFVAQTCGTRTVVVPNGVPKPPEAAGTRQPIVLVAQRLEPEKHTHLALEAWARCSLRRSGWQLEIAGRGAEMQRLEALARDLDITGSVRFAGFVDDIGERMARSSVLLATCPREAFDLAVVEAMAAGLPVVAAAGGAHREILKGFENQLFAPGEIESCVAALESVGADSGLRSQVSTLERQRYEDSYTIEHHVDELIGVYGCVTGGAGLNKVRRSHRNPSPSPTVDFGSYGDCTRCPGS